MSPDWKKVVVGLGIDIYGGIIPFLFGPPYKLLICRASVDLVGRAVSEERCSELFISDL